MSTLNLLSDKIKSNSLTIYLDECAAGCLSGDLYVCGVVLDYPVLAKLSSVKDSKTLSEKKRKELSSIIYDNCLDFEIIKIPPSQIDHLNIFEARMLGFKLAIEELNRRTHAKLAIIDGNKVPKEVNYEIEVYSLVKGDALLTGISCASVLAKHEHTLYIQELSKKDPYSKYSLNKHKGYGTKLHLEELSEFGPIEGFHRYSYAPVKKAALEFK